MSEPKLLGCPWCGYDPQVDQDGIRGVQCTYDDCPVNPSIEAEWIGEHAERIETTEEVVARWNARWNVAPNRSWVEGRWRRVKS